MSEETTGFGWMKWARNIGMALVMLTGTSVGSYASSQEMQRADASWKIEVKESLRQINERLITLEESRP